MLRPFELVLGGPSSTKPAEARDLLGPLIEAGATWWDKRRPIDDEINRIEPVLHRIEGGPHRPFRGLNIWRKR